MRVSKVFIKHKANTPNLTNMYNIQVCVWKNKGKLMARVQRTKPHGMDKGTLQTKWLINRDYKMADQRVAPGSKWWITTCYVGPVQHCQSW